MNFQIDKVEETGKAVVIETARGKRHARIIIINGRRVIEYNPAWLLDSDYNPNIFDSHKTADDRLREIDEMVLEVIKN